MMIGQRTLALRIRRHTSRPARSGTPTSRITTSGIWVLAFSRPAAPVAASETVYSPRRSSCSLSDSRRGVPVVIVPARGRPSLIAAAELANSALIAALTAWSKHAPHMLLTHNRARTLKIRLYTEDVVAVPLPSDEPVRAAQVLADPTRD